MPTYQEQFNTKMNALADSINTKAGTSGQKTIDQLKTAVDSIETGITPTGSISITSNGTTDVTNYATANVNVETGTVLVPVTAYNNRDNYVDWTPASGASGYMVVWSPGNIDYYDASDTSAYTGKMGTVTATVYALYASEGSSVTWDNPCFAKGTLVYTPNGYVAIENLKNGDKVYSYNFESKEIEEDVIEQWKLTNGCKDLCEITFDNGNVLICTPRHAFWTTNGWKVYETNEHMVIKELLNIGDEVLQADGSWLKIIEIKKISEAQPVYNLALENNTSFYVTGSKKLSPVLVEHYNIKQLVKLGIQFFGSPYEF